MSLLEILLYYVLVPIFILGAAINIHEFGHFIVAKMLGMRIDAYSFFGLGPRLFGFRWGHTDYRISAIPLGAYVKLYGDESNSGLEGKDADSEVVPDSELYELRPRWQKFLVMIGGPFMNILLALAIPFISGLFYGVPAMLSPIVAVVEPDSAAQKAGLLAGDRFIAFNGEENPSWQRIVMNAALYPEQKVPVVVERSGQRIPLEVVPTKIDVNGHEVGDLGIEPDFGVSSVIIDYVEPNTPAAEAGLQANDRIVAVNGANLRNTRQLQRAVQESKGNPLQLTVERDNQMINLTAQARKLAGGNERLGVKFSQTRAPLEPASFQAAASYAVNTNIEILRLTGTALGQVFTGSRAARDTVSGPVGIFKESASAAQTAGWEGIFSIMMLISLSLGVFNLLPIPMLDGGQIMVLFIEGTLALFGLKLSTMVRDRIQQAGFAIILLLMVFVMFNDISRLVWR